MTSKSCKLLVLGDSGVGKSTLIHQFISKEYRADFKATLGADLSTKEFEIDGKMVEAQIWDTAGSERFRSLSAQHYRGADACILVYDITSSTSFEHLDSWIREVIDTLGITEVEKFPFVLFANKSDLEDYRQVDQKDAVAWSQYKGIPLFSVSAKTGKGVDEGFNKVLRLFLENGGSKVPSMRLCPPAVESKKSSCC